MSITKKSSSGVSLVELMISMVLGLLVVGGAIGVFLSNQQTYRATESLGRIQESSRVAFELMVRDIREAGANPCSNEIPIANILKDARDQVFWKNWQDGLSGYDGDEASSGTVVGTGDNQRKDQTDAVDLNLSPDGGIRVKVKMPTSSANIEVSSTAGLNDGDLVMICDYELAAIFQVTQTPAGLKVQHNTGEGSPGNCTKGFMHPVECGNAEKAGWHEYDENAAIAKIQTVRWFVGYNGRGGTSLYRGRVVNPTGAAISVTPEEIVEGVTDMQITYNERGRSDYRDADAVSAWKDVTAVRVAIELQSLDAVGTDGEQQKVLERTLEHVVAIRSRAP